MSIMDTKVNKSGDTMTGKLTFAHGNVVAKSNAYAWNDTPAVDTYYATSEFVDKNGERMGVWEFSKNKDGTNSMNIVIKHGTGKGWDAFRLYAKSDGTSWANVPRSNVNGSILITDSHASRYMRFGNGLQICWGAGTGVQVFLQPFRDTDYMIADSDLTYHKYEGMWTTNKTTTQFEVKNSGNAQWIAIGYWY